MECERVLMRTDAFDVMTASLLTGDLVLSVLVLAPFARARRAFAPDGFSFFMFVFSHSYCLLSPSQHRSCSWWSRSSTVCDMASGCVVEPPRNPRSDARAQPVLAASLHLIRAPSRRLRDALVAGARARLATARVRHRLHGRQTARPYLIMRPTRDDAAVLAHVAAAEASVNFESLVAQMRARVRKTFGENRSRAS